MSLLMSTRKNVVVNKNIIQNFTFAECLLIFGCFEGADINHSGTSSFLQTQTLLGTTLVNLCNNSYW